MYRQIYLDSDLGLLIQGKNTKSFRQNPVDVAAYFDVFIKSSLEYKAEIDCFGTVVPTFERSKAPLTG